MTETTELQQTQKLERQKCVGHGHVMPSDLGDSPRSTTYYLCTRNCSPNSFFFNVLIFKMAVWVQISDIWKQLSKVPGYNKCPICYECEILFSS